MEFGPHSEERTNAFLALSPETRLYSNLKKEFRDASVVSTDSTDNGEDDTTSVTDDVFTLPAVTECASSMRNAPNLTLKSAAGVRKVLDPTKLLHLKSKKRRLMPPLPPVTP
ncbi:unnamed protein product, partial [Cuscuta epithymum]